MVHDSHAFTHVISTKTADSRAFALGIRNFPDDMQLPGLIIKLGLYISKAIDTGNNLGRVFTQAVQDNTKGNLTCLIGVPDNADSPFGSSKRFMPCQEAEALCAVLKQHGSQIAMAAAYFAVFRDRSGNAESLQADTNGLGCIHCRSAICFNSNRCPYGIRPAGIFKGDGLDFFDGLIRINTGILADIPAFFYTFNAVFFQHTEDFIYSSVITFE